MGLGRSGHFHLR